MNQPIPQITAELVERILEREFPNSSGEARELLNQYGHAKWHREIDRVRMACLKLSERDLHKLESMVKAACVDYRDVLAWAEYPAYMRTDPGRTQDSRAIAADWNQYNQWFSTGAQPPPPAPAEIKAQLRKVLKLLVQAIPSEKKTNNSLLACQQFLKHESYHRARSLLLYVPLQGEPDLQPVFEQAIADQKRIALPRFLPEQSKYAAFFIGDKPLETGAFGVLEPSPELPVPLNQLDLVVVPGLGFDLRGGRLGRGKGFYDRMLSEVSGVKCGICFDEQIVEGIPVEPHDVRVDFLATPSRWIDCRGSTPEKQ